MFKIAAVSRRDTRTGSCSACCLFGPAARWCVTFVFEGATATFERVGRAAAGGRCREIRLSGPLFMLYTPLKHRALRHGFKFSPCTLECWNAAHPLLVDAPPAMQQRSTIPPICPRNSRRLYVEARKGRVI